MLIFAFVSMSISVDKLKSYVSVTRYWHIRNSYCVIETDLSDCKIELATSQIRQSQSMYPYQWEMVTMFRARWPTCVTGREKANEMWG